ncbi:MAG: GGDEF domain-containing protein [Myxococcota bacterium]
MPIDDSSIPDAVVAELEARLVEAARAELKLRSQLETELACEPLAACLEPGKLFSMTLELFLERLACRRGIVLFSASPPLGGSNLAARGFEEDERAALLRILPEDKALECILGRGEVGLVSRGPFHQALEEAGLEYSDTVMSVPLRGLEHEIGQVWILSEGRPFNDADFSIVGRIADRASAALATAERYHNAKARAFIDDVTGVYNTRYLLTTADNEIQRAARYGNPLSVLFLDLDHFKEVNDRYGHLIGSDTLKMLAELLSECVRQVDTLARYGGDEFFILLVDTEHDVALRIAERIRKRVEFQLFETAHEGTLRLTISIGVATCPLHGDAREPIFNAADKAMYRAKSEGRNRVTSANVLIEDKA